MTIKLFISYRSTDATKVDKIARDLALLHHEDNNMRFVTWQDKKNLTAAHPNWWNAIVDAIIDCDVFVFNISQEALKSEVCQAELDYAHKRNRPIIPIVLDGEYIMHASGKYDLKDWSLVPAWLTDHQMLFYTGVDAYQQFQEAVDRFQTDWPEDIPLKRPPHPDSRRGSLTNHALYRQARDYAEKMAFPDAEKIFRDFVKNQDTDYREIARDWLVILDTYAELMDIGTDEDNRYLFDKKWTAYKTLASKPFLKKIFDPKGFGKQIKKKQYQRKKRFDSWENPFSRFDLHQNSEDDTPSIDLMSAPFAWIEIPACKPTHFVVPHAYGITTTEELFGTPKFSIGKYPITNAQFARFVELEGYSKQRWWNEEGWKIKTKENWTTPLYWDDEKWNGVDHPVVGVSWYESMAFCRWLSEITGEKISLPTDMGWKYAAYGDKKLKYPWGNDWNTSCCNDSITFRDKGEFHTTPVQQYEGKGDSPYGVVDMIGNVFEWCDTKRHYQSMPLGDSYYIVHGGSSRSNKPSASGTTDHSHNPEKRFDWVGFRIARYGY